MAPSGIALLVNANAPFASDAPAASPAPPSVGAPDEPDVPPEPAPDVEPETAPDAVPDMAPDAVPDAVLDEPEAKPDALPEAEPAVPDIEPELDPEAEPDAAPELEPEALPVPAGVPELSEQAPARLIAPSANSGRKLSRSGRSTRVFAIVDAGEAMLDLTAWIKPMSGRQERICVESGPFDALAPQDTPWKRATLALAHAKTRIRAPNLCIQIECRCPEHHARHELTRARDESARRRRFRIRRGRA
jgi:hypothetical protein